MMTLGAVAIAAGVLLIAQEHSDTLDAILPDLLLAWIAGPIVIVAGAVLIARSV